MSKRRRRRKSKGLEMKGFLLIGLCLLMVGCTNQDFDPFNRDCKVIEKGSIFDMELSGTYLRADDQSCCVVPSLKDSILKKKGNYTIQNSFLYCTEERTRENVTIFT
jgi:hypothetical protein